MSASANVAVSASGRTRYASPPRSPVRKSRRRAASTNAPSSRARYGASLIVVSEYRTGSGSAATASAGASRNHQRET